MNEVEYWDREATEDPRYAQGWWGMDDADDALATIEAILAILDKGMPNENGFVVEIGCGPGRLLLEMAERWEDAEFYGTDISLEMLQLCANRRDDAYRSVRNFALWHLLSGELDPLRVAGVIDLVYCVELFQHLDDETVRAYIAQARTALKSGGKFIAQFVIRGERGPHSYPRDTDLIAQMFDHGWSRVHEDHAVHPDWVFITATKR